MTHSRSVMQSVASTRRPAARQRAAAVASDVRQEQILDRAVELVVKGGLASLTMKRIAEDVGFSEAALYRHFPTKQGLLLALMDRLERILLDPIRAMAADATPSPSERLSRILTHHLRIVLDHSSLPLLLLAEASASGDATLVQRMRDIFDPYRALLRDLLAQTIPTGRVSAADASTTTQQTPGIGPDALALLLLGVPAALAIQHRLQPDRDIERQAITEITPWLLAAIRDTPAVDSPTRPRR